MNEQGRLPLSIVPDSPDDKDGSREQAQPYFDKIEVNVIPPREAPRDGTMCDCDGCLLESLSLVLLAMKRGQITFSYENLDDPLPMFIKFNPSKEE